MENNTDCSRLDKEKREEIEMHGRLGIMELANMISVPMCLTALIKLNVADIIWQNGLNEPQSALEILSQVPTTGTLSKVDAAINLDRMMRMLASYHVFKETLSANSNGILERLYSLTEVGKNLVKDEKGLSYGSYVLQHHQNTLLGAWPLLHEAVTDPKHEPFRKVYGKSFYEFNGDDDSANDLMRTAMASLSLPFMNAMLKSYGGFGGIRKLVDVGGSSGYCLHLITQKYNRIQGINFDLPYVVAGAPAYDGVTHVGGDMFVSIPSADAIFMKWVLTTWSDDKCIQILRNCHKALPAGGKVIACEPVVPKHTDDSQKTRSLIEADIFIMAIYWAGARERTEDEYRQMGLLTGFSKLRAFYFDHFFAVLEFQK